MKYNTVWGGKLKKRFYKMFSESSTGRWAPCCPSKQGELAENILQNHFNKTVEMIFRLEIFSIPSNNKCKQPCIRNDQLLGQADH